MITLKLASKLLMVAAPVSGGVGGTVYLMTNSSNKATSPTNIISARRRKNTLRNYLIQSVSETEEASKLSCELTTTCKLFSRDTASDKKETNLKALTSFADLNINDHYVLSIDGKDLNEDDLVSVSSNNQTKKFKVISSMSYKTDKLKIPKPPTKLLPKEKWINLNGLPTTDAEPNTDSDAFDQLKNRFFINQAYPTHIEWEGFNHKKYVVLKWKEVAKDNKLHINKMNMFFLPKDAESTPTKNWQNTLLKNKKTSSFSLFQHPFDAGIVDGITDLDAKIDTVDQFLFKPFNTQHDEWDEVGSLEVKIIQHTGEPITSKEQIKKIFFEHEHNTPLEIYEIADQTNIGKAFPTSPNTEGNASLVDWDQIDKDGKMITKASEMKDGHYYKFVFEDESFMDKVFQHFWIKLEVILHNKAVGDSDITKNEIFNFDVNQDDFYCYRSPKENKCLYFKDIEDKIPRDLSNTD